MSTYSTPVEEEQDDENRYRMTIQDNEDIKNGTFRWSSKLYDSIRDFVNNNGWEILYEVTGSTNVFEIVQEQWALFDMYQPSKVVGQFDGVPQGSPTSPLLAISVLGELLSQVESVSYADDPIFYSNKPFKITDDPNKGIILNHDKSGWVKKDGKWLKPLKYLCMEYDGEKETFSSATRNNAKVTITNNYRNKIMNVFGGKKSWKGLLNSHVMGLLQSSMYSGSFSTQKVIQEFRLKFTHNSWTSLMARKYGKPYVVNNITAANKCSIASKSIAFELSRNTYKYRKVFV